jgi:predicted nucleotidyltransferase
MGQRQLPQDFKDFIKFLNVNKVKYILLGGWAVGIHGSPRATKDIDFLIAVDDVNLKRLQKAMFEFGAPTIDMAIFKEKGNFFRMGRPPIQIDLIADAAGIDIKSCLARRKLIEIDDVAISVISKEDLIKNKRAAGRHRDMDDAEILEKGEIDKKRRRRRRRKRKGAG